MDDKNKIIKDIIISQKNFNSLPRNEFKRCIYEGNLNISNRDISRLPEYFTVTGDLMCHNTSLNKLPKGLIILGEFDVCDSELDELPRDLLVYGDFYFFNNNVSSIPACVKENTKGDIFCYNNLMSVDKIIKGVVYYDEYNPLDIPSYQPTGETTSGDNLNDDDILSEDELDKLDKLSQVDKDIFLRVITIKRRAKKEEFYHHGLFL